MKTNGIKEIEISRIRPDPNQPRAYFDEEELKEMAVSLSTTGVINPIEIDKDFVIVTGERRWRAAKIAGLKTIRAIIIEIEEDERYMRQVIENVHHNTMTDYETAKSFRRLIDDYLSHGVEQIPRTPGRPDVGVTWLSGKTGKSTGFVGEKLDLLDLSPQTQKAIEKGDIVSSFGRAIKRTPEEYKKQMEEKILSKEIKFADGAVTLAAALNREVNNPDRIKKLLGINYSKHKDEEEMRNAVNKVSPPPRVVLAKSFEPSSRLGGIAGELMEWVELFPKEKIMIMHAKKVMIHMTVIRNLADKWLASQGNLKEKKRQKLLEGKSD